MKILFLLPFISLTVSAYAGNPYPRSPNLSLTPGSLCKTPIEYRYPERIPYCDREALNGFQKQLVFENYRKLGFSLSGERNQYKVDHFIPLCAGGSNELTNLWPQYYTISERTDPLEPLACKVLAKGKITQRELIDLVTDAKLDVSKVPEAMKVLNRLNR